LTKAIQYGYNSGDRRVGTTAYYTLYPGRTAAQVFITL